MFLQRIELHGFKSFANRTVLEFPSPDKKSSTCGITAIVGPNGSGKSNVVDAVRWVLGEQSLKLLRGKKATDVIFSGSAKKAQLSLAEVSLYLNNEDQLASIDYTEVVITRKLYRDGSSEYLLNNQEVRLFDIVMLLAQANFGHNTYSIIGQGLVDKIVNYSNEERKEFFDEATGVKQFQIKRERSVLKLKRSRENLEQARTLVVELEPRLRSLTRQVNKLRQRQEIEVELRELQNRYYGRLWHDLSAQYDEFALSYNTYDKQRLRLENKISEWHSRLEEISAGGSRTDDFNRLQEEYNSVLNKQNNTLRELALLRGQLEIEYRKSGKHDLSFLENRRVELEQKIKELSARHKSSRLKADDNVIKLAERERRLKVLSDELLVWQNNLEIMQEDYYRQKSGGKISQHDEAIKELLAQKNKIDGILGTVSDLGKVKNSKYEMALVAAAGNRLSAVVVETDGAAAQCINWLKANRLPALTFFPLNRLKAAMSAEIKDILSESGVIGLASDLIGYDRKYQKVFELVFGSTIVVEDIDAAKAIGINRERMVTLDGDVLEKTGMMRGGFRKPESLKWKFLSDKFFPEAKIKEIAALKAKLEEQRRERENLFIQVNDLKAIVSADDDKIKNLASEVEINRKELDRVLDDLKSLKLSPEETSEFLHQTTEKKEAAEAALAEIEKDLGEARDKLDEFNLSEEKKKQEIFAIQQESYSAQTELNRINIEFNQVKIELAKVETRREDTLSAIRENLGDSWQFNRQDDYGDLDVEESKSRIDKLKKQLELIGGIDPEVEKEYGEVQARFEFLSEQSLDLERAIKDLEKVIVELDKLIKTQFEAEFERINKDFSRYFKQLFDGGSAKLALVQKQEEQTEAEKIRQEISSQDLEPGIDNMEQKSELESQMEEKEKKIVYPEDKSFLANMGIEIEATPPGKKIKSMAMLSGGEKTMTALALICAIINNNPSPFILFDEVDAALDESNSAKFSGIVKELAHKTQFVIITHNRAIMSEADVLYGVTMQGDGVSRLISLKLSEAEGLGK